MISTLVSLFLTLVLSVSLCFIKPSKSRSISVIKGKLTEHQFYMGEESIPTVSEKPVKSLGRWYHATLKETEQVDQLRQDTICGLESIHKTMLPTG